MSNFQSMPHYHDRDCPGQHQRDSTTNHNRDMKTLAERLIAAREGKGWTQPELARAAGVKNQSSIGMLESGARKSSSYIPAIANALNISALWLAEGKGPRTLGEASNTTTTANPPTAHEPSADAALEQMSVEARAKILVDQAGEVSALWMALPAERRTALLLQLRDEAGHPPGEARILAPLKPKPAGATRPDTKARREAG